MDAAVEAKAHSIISRFKDVPEKAVIVDIGSGTGALAEYITRFYRNQGATVYAVDISHELLEIADNNRSFMNLVFGDATDLGPLPSGFADVAYHGTIGHELYSISGEKGLHKALNAVYRVLKPGGQEVWRDFAKPDIEGDVYMRIFIQDGTDNVDEATSDGFLDYSKLSTRALFERFHDEFLGGHAFEYERVTMGGHEYIRLPARFAHEFMLRKDYTANWRQEIMEEYLYWTTEEAQRAFESAGFTDVRAEPDDSEYIRAHRLRNKVGVYRLDDGDLVEIEFPTHMVISGRKPNENGHEYQGSDPAVDYEKIVSTIHIDEEGGRISIGEAVFDIDSMVGMGAHKRVFALRDTREVIKIVRTDEPDIHNVFKSMQQMIDRQHILEDHNVPHMDIVSVDPEGPPYRYVIQKMIPENAVCAAELILQDGLADRDIQQMADIVNAFELGKMWQIDTNPYNWYRVTDENGKTTMVFVGGTVYSYDERWQFSRVGLLQWVDKQYIERGRNSSSAIPKAHEADLFAENWSSMPSRSAELWRERLSQTVQPRKKAHID